MKKVFWGLLSFCLSLSVAQGHAADYVVKKEAVEDRKAVIATVESVREVQARARINGTLSYIAVKEGDHVEAGDKIAVVGDPKLAIRGQGLEARMQAAQSAYDKAKIDYARANDLRQSGYGTQAKLDEARANLQIAEQNLQAARAEKQEVVQQATEGAVLAPNAGRVLKVPVAVGGVVLAGETVAVLSQENYVLRLELPERHARYLKVGDTVSVGVRGLQQAGEESARTGTVKLVYPEIKDGRVIADVSASDLGDYFVGERTRVYVSAGVREAFMVPVELVHRRGGIDYVTLKNIGDIVVLTGQRIDGRIEILSGLRENDEVVVP